MYFETIKNIPLPTPEQYVAFKDHVCWAHSWYKHLSLLQGAFFVFFVAPDAGGGYTSDRRRIDYSWETTEEYRRRFGYLDYMYRLESGGQWYRDVGAPIPLPKEIIDRCSCTLFPYVSTDFNAQEAIDYPMHEKALEKLRQGSPHPDREAILELSRLFTKMNEIELTDEEYDSIIAYDTGKKHTLPENISPALRTYLETSDRYKALYNTLQSAEENKIENALNALYTILMEMKNSQENT